MRTKQFPWPMLASIYITQYIGVAFITSAAVAILRKQGIALDKLALLNLIALPLFGKIFYAPFIDKYRLFFQGRYRSWLILAQGCMTLLLLIIGFMSLDQQFSLILIGFVIYVFFMSLQDVSVDGLSCKLFDVESRKLGSSVQFSGNLLGNIIGGGVILMIYPWIQWQGALLILAGLTLISLIQILFYQEPEHTSNDEILTSENPALFRSLIGFIKQHYRWFIVLCVYPIASTCGFALVAPVLVDNGWQMGDIGFVMKIYGSLIGLLSALLATPLISRLGRFNALLTVIAIQALALLLMIPMTLGHADKLMVYIAITTHFIAFPAMLVVSATIIMDKAAQTAHKATFFALQFSLASTLGFMYSGFSMTLAKHFGYDTVLIVGTAIAFCIVPFAWLMLRSEYKQKLVVSA